MPTRIYADFLSAVISDAEYLRHQRSDSSEIRTQIKRMYRREFVRIIYRRYIVSALALWLDLYIKKHELP